GSAAGSATPAPTSPPPGSGQDVFHVGIATRGAPNPADPTFIRDQDGLFDPGQFSNPQLYPSSYHWRIDPTLTVRHVTHVMLATNPNTRQPAIVITFDATGAAEWSLVTTRAYNEYVSAPTSPGAQVAFFIGKEVVSAPYVVGGGQSNETEITGSFTQAQAEQIVSTISAAIGQR
ncbi:MAG: hypothetical protein JOY80_01870, partial [Candidatus Dormibacteraeota bacterium]|nr:hypothetical protein [Candidatus Dormibacteraeota bacterium]